MAKATTDDKVNPKKDAQVRPYPPSWVNRLSAWVDRRLGSIWSLYLGLGLVLVVILVATLWMEGVYPVGTVFAVQFFIPAMIALFLAMIHFLDSRAQAALATLRSALSASEEEYDQLCYQLTTLPAVPTLLASMTMIAVVFLLGLLTGERESSIEALATSPVAASLLVFVYYIGWWVLGAFIYHTIHQLRVISRIHTEHTHVSLFAMSPLYAFSGVTAPTAVTLVIATYGWTALNPDNLSNPTSIVFISLITVLAALAFAWPLLGTRKYLAKEKAQRLDQVSLRLEAVFSRMHECIDSEEIDELEDLNKVVSVLETERDMLEAISTWPWQPETLRFLASALLLPLLLWIIQYVLNLVLGP